MSLRTRILKFLYKISPFSLKGDAIFESVNEIYDISCVINFYGRTELLRKILTCLANQDLDKSTFEVLLVEDRGGTNEGKNTSREFSDYLNINYITLDKNFGKMGYSRNVGIARTKGRYVLLLDDDTIILQNDFLTKLIKNFKDNDSEGIIPLGIASYCLVKGKYQYHDRFFPANKCTALRKSVLKELGGYMDEIIGQEDVEFYMRYSLAGKKFMKSTELEYFHPPFIFNDFKKAAAVGSSYTNIRNRYPFTIWLLLILNGLRYLPYIFIPLTTRIRMHIIFSTGFLVGIFYSLKGKDIQYS